VEKQGTWGFQEVEETTKDSNQIILNYGVQIQSVMRKKKIVVDMVQNKYLLSEWTTDEIIKEEWNYKNLLSHLCGIYHFINVSTIVISFDSCDSIMKKNRAEIVLFLS
jgi:hypothetical protein